MVKDGFAYVFRGENRLEDYERDFLGGFSRTVASFRRMRRDDLEAATTRIALVEAKPNTYKQLARKASSAATAPMSALERGLPARPAAGG